jgi:hypothetical protein
MGLTQWPPQTVPPNEQSEPQVLLKQYSGAWHGIPQPPQLFTSDEVSTHWLPQIV